MGDQYPFRDLRIPIPSPFGNETCSGLFYVHSKLFFLKALVRRGEKRIENMFILKEKFCMNWPHISGCTDIIQYCQFGFLGQRRFLEQVFLWIVFIAIS
jgi:hypothetical protein